MGKHRKDAFLSLEKLKAPGRNLRMILLQLKHNYNRRLGTQDNKWHLYTSGSQHMWIVHSNPFPMVYGCHLLSRLPHTTDVALWILPLRRLRLITHPSQHSSYTTHGKGNNQATNQQDQDIHPTRLRGDEHVIGDMRHHSLPRIIQHIAKNRTSSIR